MHIFEGKPHRTWLEKEYPLLIIIDGCTVSIFMSKRLEDLVQDFVTIGFPNDMNLWLNRDIVSMAAIV